MKIHFHLLIKSLTLFILLLGFIFSFWQIVRYYSFSNFAKTGSYLNVQLPPLKQQSIEKYLASQKNSTSTASMANVKNIFAFPKIKPD